ncbi:peroxiredoxin family protein [Salinicoccus siamensis]|uniref:Peroxiredoxin family protein n=1 Tax=Salinicoccus siamensis TaxID=381830 RepID=A0ABV5Z560_9STAP
MPQFKLNEQFPDFSLESLEGETLTFSDVLAEKGNHWHLIVYFRGSWCPACVEELDEFESSKSYFDKHNINLITITHDDKEDLEKMIDDHGFTFPVLVDDDYEFLDKYGIHYHGEDAPYEDHGRHPEPAYFLTDEGGRLMYQQKQTSPFGRPHPNELRKIIQYIRKNLK